MAQTAAPYSYNAPPIPGMTGTLMRASDGAFIPCDLGNMDYQAFLAWIAAENTAPSGWTGPTNPS
jgi:hypothetical protein